MQNQGQEKWLGQTWNTFLSLVLHSPKNIDFTTTTETRTEISYHDFFERLWYIDLSIFSIRMNLDKLNHSTGSALMLYLLTKKSSCVIRVSE